MLFPTRINYLEHCQTFQFPHTNLSDCSFFLFVNLQRLLAHCIKKLFFAARKGDDIALDALKETAKYLGIGLAGVVNLLNPEIVVIGGGIAEGGANFLEHVSQEMKQRVLPPAVDKLSVVKAALGNDAGFIGAGLLGEKM